MRRTDSTVQWRWSVEQGLWQRWCSNSKRWVHDHPSLPQWFLDAGGVVSTRRFLRLWVQSASWAELHQSLFWWPVDELQAMMVELTAKLLEMKVQPPPILNVPESFDVFDIRSLIEEGIVASLDDRPVNSEGGYDPMKAIFQAQSQRQEQMDTSRPQFQTLEQGKFTARH